MTVNGYNVQDIAGAASPQSPELERRLWYQYYLHGDRGAAGLRAHRAEYARLLWHEWSPTWSFTDADFAASAPSFDNPDFVDVVVHSYRHRFGLADDDPAYASIENVLTGQPPITVPTIVLDGLHDTVRPPQQRSQHELHFPALVDHRLLDAGHNVPQEVPDDFARAVADLLATL